MGDPFDINPAFEAEMHYRRQEEYLKRRPVCIWCGNPIQDEEAVLHEGNWICQTCIDENTHNVDAYIER